MPERSPHTFAVLAYQESPYLEECITSLLNQTTPSAIFLSTSTPSAFLDALANKYQLPLALNAQPTGIGSDWTYALQHANTKYVTLAHQDDIYLPQYTEHCVATAEQFPAALIAFTDYQELIAGQLQPSNLLLLIKRLMLWPAYGFTQHLSAPWLKRLLLAVGNPVSCPTIMYHTDNIGPFEFHRALLTNLDWEALLRLAHRPGAFLYIKKKLVLHRIHRTSQTTSQLSANVRQTEDKIMLDKTWPKWIAKLLATLYAFAYQSNQKG